jgi:hypothetical protein
VALASLTTYWRGAVRVTVVAKATLAFSPGGEMALAAPVPIVRADTHFDDQPERSVRDPSDLAPHLERAEILFRGHAQAPGGTPVPEMRVRLALAGDRGVVLDKTLRVIGDRARPGDAPAPFAKMRIGYERTAGGPDHPANPIGVGFTGGLPNILHADPARASEPACFGPLAAAWPVRRALLRHHDVPVLDGGPRTLPDDLDWSYFQAAPVDQRLAELPERAWILLEGLHPEHASLRMRLPHLVATARLYSRSQGETTFALRADTILVDGESHRCTVTWRGTFPLPSAESLADLVVAAAGVHAPGQALAWPVMPTAKRTAVAASPRKAPVPTMSIDLASLRAPLPFQAVSLGEMPTPAPPPKPAASAKEPADDTLDDVPSPFARSALPFHEVTAGGSKAWTSTPHPFPAAAIAGAPWSDVPVVRPPPEDAGLGGTLMMTPSPFAREVAPATTGAPVAPPAMVAPPPMVEPAPQRTAERPPLHPAATPEVVARSQAPVPAPPPPPAATLEVVARPQAPPQTPPPPPAVTPARPEPAPIPSIPRVPAPGASSRQAYGKFGPKRS